ncbi:hypothetical protein F4806DRAFT_498423 [Annulohypoxylon nitens]|nr:hypothetical protein F4806DRAFT_498423 [Annulohypoxylon nitens]
MKLLIPNADANNYMHSVIELSSLAEVFFQNRFGYSGVGLRVSDDIIVKIGRYADGTDEYSALQYLEAYLLRFSAPRPHGMIKLEHLYFVHMTSMPDLDLEEARPQLNVAQKQDISSQLDALFSELRSLPFPEDGRLGGIQGEPCKDARWFICIAPTSNTNVKEFEDFIFSGTCATLVYLDFLRGLRRLYPRRRPTHKYYDQV